MALGDQAGLQAVQTAVAQIPGLEAFLGEKVNDLHAALVATLQGSINQAGAVIQADLAPAMAQLAVFNKNVADLVGLLSRLLDGGLQLTAGRPPNPAP